MLSFFFGDQLIYLHAIVIKPVLMFSRLVPKGGYTGIKDCGLEQDPVLFDAIKIFLLEAFPK